jgi:lipopolysaccharide/colanic/teichoic acid biosynthesis glycosyltransferase
MDSKRALDLFLITASAPVYGSVLLGLTALVWLCDGSPVFFAQERVGRDRKRFRILKLRTMTTEEDPAQRRPTRLGAWLRRRGLDEIPQFLSVLVGDMSLVGPRPLTPADVERLVALHPPLAARFAVPPGITGLSQVCQVQGAQRTAQLDAYYADKRSLRMDLVILAYTAWINVVGKARGRMALAVVARDLVET